MSQRVWVSSTLVALAGTCPWLCSVVCVFQPKKKDGTFVTMFSLLTIVLLNSGPWQLGQSGLNSWMPSSQRDGPNQQLSGLGHVHWPSLGCLQSAPQDNYLWSCGQCIDHWHTTAKSVIANGQPLTECPFWVAIYSYLICLIPLTVEEVCGFQAVIRTLVSKFITLPFLFGQFEGSKCH